MLNFVIPLRRDTLNVFYCRKNYRPVRLKSDERRNIISHSALLV